MSRRERRRSRATWPWLAGLAALAAACGGDDASRTTGHADDHAHEDPQADDHAQAPPRADAHHRGGHEDCHDDIVLPPSALERHGIAVEPARAVLLAPTVSAPGHLAFPDGALARIGSAVDGRVIELCVRTGDRVAAGDRLLVVESPELALAQSESLQRRAVAAAAERALELARSAHARARELFDSVQGVSLTEVERREAELRQAERERDVAAATSAAARDRLTLLGLSREEIERLHETHAVVPSVTVRAPIGGRVVLVAVTPGELVDRERAPLIVVGDLSSLWAIAEVSESRLSEVALGAEARLTVPALAGAAFTSRVAAVPTTLEATTRTAEVRMDVANPDEALLPGMFLQVEIASSRAGAAPVLAVPDGAVLEVAGEPSVFVPTEPGGHTFCRHTVRVGPAVGELIPVLDGLAPGDLVVVSGAFLLKAELGKGSARHEH